MAYDPFNGPRGSARILVALCVTLAGALAAAWFAAREPVDGAVRASTVKAAKRAVFASRELGPVAPLVPHAAPDSRALVEASSADVTVLHVAVVDFAGRAVTGGWLECLSATTPEPETAREPHHTRVAIAGATTELRLSAAMNEALLTASAPKLGVARTRVTRLRAVGDAWQARGELHRTARVGLGIPPPRPRIHGAMRVDGVPRAPLGLAIVLVDEEDGVGSPGFARDAAIDVADARYELAPVAAGAEGLWITSPSTAPAWIALDGRAGREDVELDLELSSGIALELEVVDASTRVPLAGVRLRTQLLVPVRFERDVEDHRATFGELTTDQRGRARLAGLPLRGSLMVSEGAERAGTPLLELALTPACAERGVITIELERGEPALAFGPAPDATRFGAAEGELSLCTAVIGGERRVSLAPRALGANAAWELALQPGREIELWLAAGRRVSRVERVEARPGERIGPIVFEPRERWPVELCWSGGELGARVAIAIAGGGEHVGELELDASSGSHALELDGACRLELVQTTPDGARSWRFVDCDPARERVVAVDFAAPRAHAVCLTLDGARPSGAQSLALWRLADDATGALVVAELDDGCSTGEIALETGFFFFRWLDAPAGELVCGVAAVGAAHELALDWLGAPCDAPGMPRSLELVALGEHELASRVPAHLRTFSLGAGASARCPSGARWNVHRGPP